MVSGFTTRVINIHTGLPESPPEPPSFTFSNADAIRRSSFATRLNNMLQMATLTEGEDTSVFEDDSINVIQQRSSALAKELTPFAKEVAHDVEADSIDRSIQILPGVREMIDSIPRGSLCRRYLQCERRPTPTAQRPASASHPHP